METSIPYKLSDTFRLMHAASYWLPPDGIAQQWGTFGSESTTASAFLATSMAFSALPCEAGAHQHYTLGWSSHQQGSATVLVSELTQSIEEVTEAIRQWSGAINWLNWLLTHERHEARYGATINTLHTHSTQYTQRLPAMLQAMQQEMLDACKEQGILLSIGISEDLPHGTDEKTKVLHQSKEASR
jgi:hypothetical protein